MIKAFNIPNKLSLLRILLVPIICFFIEAEYIPLNFLWAAAVYGVASLTDMLDGYIARRYNLITDLGKFLDPLADKLLTSSLFIYMLVMGYTSAPIIIIIFSREFAVTSLRAVAASKNYVIAAGLSGKLKTVFQIVVTLLWLSFLVMGQLGFETSYAVSVINWLMWAVAGITLISGLEYLYAARSYLTK